MSVTKIEGSRNHMTLIVHDDQRDFTYVAWFPEDSDAWALEYKDSDMADYIQGGYDYDTEKAAAIDWVTLYEKGE